MNFPTTRWTIVADATLSGGEAERSALEAFCQSYWKPVSLVIQRKGAPVEKVEDLTQEFFVLLMERSFSKRADRNHGKFRTFLLNALKNFLADDLRKLMAQKRGGDQQRVELSEDVGLVEEDCSHFDQAWAESLFDAALANAEEDVINRRDNHAWELLKPFLAGGQTPVTYEQLGQGLGVTAGGAKAEVSRLRSKFRESLRSEVAKTVDAPHEIDEELAYLRDVMMQRTKTG